MQDFGLVKENATGNGHIWVRLYEAPSLKPHLNFADATPKASGAPHTQTTPPAQIRALPQPAPN